jgi:hypothetical protein
MANTLPSQKWPLRATVRKAVDEDKSMFCRVPGWNDHDDRSVKFDEAQAAKAEAKAAALAGDAPAEIKTEVA